MLFTWREKLKVITSTNSRLRTITPTLTPIRIMA